jgi:hypothetical protein
MQIEKYETESTVSSLIFTFESVGEKVIKKRVIYSKFNNPEDIGLSYDSIVYNLGFGDFNEKTGELDDQIISKNGDTEQVLATVAGTAFDFWIEYPDALIFFMGSIPEGEKARRTRLYQMKINRYFADISLIVDIDGLTENGWETLSKDKNYVAFLISQKNQVF